MTSQEMQMVLGYLIDKLDPASKEEVATLLGGELPDLGQDALTKGGLALDRLPERIKRRAISQLSPGAVKVEPTKYDVQSFPNSGRLK